MNNVSPRARVRAHDLPVDVVWRPSLCLRCMSLLPADLARGIRNADSNLARKVEEAALWIKSRRNTLFK